MIIELTNLKWIIRIYLLMFLGYYNNIPLKRFYKFFNNKKKSKKINIVHYIDFEYVYTHGELSQKDINVLKFLNNIIKFNKFFNINPYLLVDDQLHKIKYKNKELLEKLFRNGFQKKIDKYITNYIWIVNSIYLMNNPVFNYKKEYDSEFIPLIRDYLHAHDIRICRCDFLVDVENRFTILNYHFRKLIK